MLNECKKEALSFFLESLKHSHVLFVSVNRQSDDPVKSPVYDPRYLMIETHKCSNLGISLVGGNAVGIFVHSVQSNSLAYNSGLR